MRNRGGDRTWLGQTPTHAELTARGYRGSASDYVSLDDLDLDDVLDWEDVNLDELPWAPPRPTLGVLAGSETSTGDEHGFDYDGFLAAFWDGTSDPQDQHEQRWVTAQREPDPPRWEPEAYQYVHHRHPLAVCNLCGQIVRRNQYAQHWMMCKDDVAVEA